MKPHRKHIGKSLWEMQSYRKGGVDLTQTFKYNGFKGTHLNDTSQKKRRRTNSSLMYTMYVMASGDWPWGSFRQYGSQEEYLLLKETTNDYLNNQKMISAVKLITLKY